MPRHPRTTGRPAPYAALLLVLSALLAALLPVGAAPAYADTAAEPGDCAVLPLAPFGDPGSAVASATLPEDGTVCYTFTAEQPGLHRVLVHDLHGETGAQVYDGAAPLNCYDAEWGSAGWCELPHAGAYTVTVANYGWTTDTFDLAVVALATTANCGPETGTSWDTPAVDVSVPGPLGMACVPFTGTAGERVLLYADGTTLYAGATSWITDATGARICPHFNEDDSIGCVLPGDGPYRVLRQVTGTGEGSPAEHTVAVRRLSDPAGCETVPLNTFGSGPTATTPGTECKVFTAPKAGRYDVYQVSSDSRSGTDVYDRAGKSVCRSCELPAGTYTVLTDQSTLILDRSSTAGCRPAGLGTYHGELGEVGEVDCLTLSLPEGARMAALRPLSTTGPSIDVVVVDAEGVQRCDGTDLAQGSCALTGTGPFRALVSTTTQSTPTGPYDLAFHRTDDASGCQVFPAGDFTAASASAGFGTGDGAFSHCLTIPADDHSAMETLHLRAAPGTTGTARFSVLDADGKQVCSAGPSLLTWVACGLTPGVAHTVLVTGRETAATYTLVRRDVTATAKGCTANPATAVGGPSTGGALGVPGETVCRQVTTANAGDTLHVNVRDALGTANSYVFDADGKSLCLRANSSCAVSGSTRYQVLVTVPSSLKAASSYRFDALRIATPQGPAPECGTVPNISYGYGPVTGTLDEQHTAVCAALPTAYHDRFDVPVTDTAGATETAVPALYDESLDNGCTLYIPSGYQCSVNEPATAKTTPSVFVLGLPEKAAQTSYRAELVCTSGPCGTERIGVTGVTPTTGPSGGRTTVTVTGSALHQDDKVRIYRSGGTPITATTVSVSADRRTLTAVLDLSGVAPGTLSLSVFTHDGWERQQGTFTVTEQPALKATTAPAVKGTVRVGEKLTASPGTWSAAPEAYAYQWRADGTAISGATGSAYTVPSSLLGKKLTVTVTARRAGYRDGTATTPSATVAKGLAPKATAHPAIKGTVRVGVKLTAAPGTWSPAPSSYAYQWKADGKAISGATKSTYTVPASLAGRKLSLTVTARRAGCSDGSATTSAVTVARGLAPKATKLPAISGTAKVGRTLTAGHGTWSPAPTSYRYQWYANGKAIAGATKSTLVLKSAQRGKRITVKVSAVRTGHSTGSATSRATPTVAR
ncbi:IPT/TIG domain-containing protein [Streptomyces sp. MI02-7b]|uniref:IPT/TIG domain-containing protein n=1 Tax=Streptomyces sp. MI02-7b TaxID=462941 RepID=UPI0029A59B44|nr:IPT/TIG domain-containing protein [Streptomyces sp. MI02-7b]MDX3073331.1 IPT/TIG domain-containing protein [Streptomyces sp. MI02-7b]